MASVVVEKKTNVNRKTGKAKQVILYRVEFLHPTTKKLHLIRFSGKLDKVEAKEFANRLDRLIASKTANRSDRLVNEWLDDLDADIHTQLVGWGLADPRIDPSAGDADDPGVMEFIDKYTESLTDVSERTRLFYVHARDCLESFLTKELKQPRTLKGFTKADAIAFRNWVLAHESLKQNSELHAENYVRTQCKNLKLFFGAAVDVHLITENPFQDKLIPCKVQPERWQ